MQTQKNPTMSISKTATLFLVLLVMTACGGNQSNDSETAVKPPATDIHTATFLGDLKAIHQHIKAGSDLNEKEPMVGSTPLIAAAVFGKTDVAIALIEGGADVNLQNNEGSTALHSAAFLCRTEMATPADRGS